MRRRIPLVVVLVLVVGLGAAALVVLARSDDRGLEVPADAVSSGLPPEAADIVVVGDSVTDQSADELTAALTDRRASVVGRPGFTTTELLPTIEAVVAGEPRTVVVMSGYNDLWTGNEEIGPVRDAVELLAGVDCAVWVLVPTAGAWQQERAREFDAQVRQVAAEAGVAVETGWRDAVDAPGGGDPDPALVSEDEVHPNEAGQQRVAEVMVAAIDRECG